MAAWKVAGSLDELLGQLNALAPGRSKVADGSIGDAAHAARTSDHNPHWIYCGQAYVTARDFTHDRGGGLDCARLAATLAAHRDERIKYVIWSGQIMSGARASSAWQWRPYAGPNPHNHHLHLSVVADPGALSPRPWDLSGMLAEPGPAVATEPWRTLPTLRHGDKGPAVEGLQRFISRTDWTPDLVVPATGFYGDATVNAVRRAQAQCRVTGADADGTTIGPRTKAAFWTRGWRP